MPRHLTALLAAFGAACGAASAELRVHHIFDSNMVLRRDKPVRVWGWAEAGETIRVHFGKQSRPVKAGKDGRWGVHLDPMPASAQPRTFAVRGKGNTVTYGNVLVGDACGSRPACRPEFRGHAAACPCLAQTPGRTAFRAASRPDGTPTPACRRSERACRPGDSW